MDLRSDFSRSLAENPLHFAAHSHHPWPNAAREAHMQCWDDAAKLLDHKWTHIFTHVVPEAQQHIAQELNLSSPQTICFAPNTHNFIMRLISCLPSPAKILTTDAEFHSLSRQLNRLTEAKKVDATYIETYPYETFEERFIEASKTEPYDLIFCSHVFFNSGFTIKNLNKFVNALPPEPTVVIDGYHGYMALPTDLGSIEDRIFYLAGGYKYAMSGEGVCFMHCPTGWHQRPVDTGWYAAFGELAKHQPNTVPYAASGMRFAGATFDHVGIYRLNGVMAWLKSRQINTSTIHSYIIDLQEYFINKTSGIQALSSAKLISPRGTHNRGHFLTYQVNNAAELTDWLNDLGIVIDCRGDRIRFGFGIYHTRECIDQLAKKLAEI